MKSTRDIIPSQLKHYVGMRFPIENPRIRAVHMAFSMYNECMAGPRTPFGAMSRNGVLLNEETHDFLYNSTFGQITEPYRAGRYPTLERYIDSLINDRMSDGDKMIALSQSLHQAPAKYPRVPVFLYGEDDQDTLLKGGGHCSCKGRLLSAIAQMIGLQGRPCFQWTWIDFENNPDKLLGGHTVAEILIDGHWGFFDPEHACYCCDNDRFYSMAEIRQSREVWTQMPENITRDMQVVDYADRNPSMNFYEYYWYKNFDPRCPTQISCHDVNGDYEIKWSWATDEYFTKGDQDFQMHKKMLIDMGDRGELTDEVYQLGLEAFRERFNITQRNVPSQDDTPGSSPKAPRKLRTR